MKAAHRGLLLPEKLMDLWKWCAANFTCSQPDHLMLGEWALTLEKKKSCLRGWRGKVSLHHPTTHPSGKDCVGDRKERSREGRKKKQQEADTRVNPLSGRSCDVDLPFLWKCWALCCSLFGGLAHLEEWLMGVRDVVNNKFSPVNISEPSKCFHTRPFVPYKTSYACNGLSGASPVGRLFLVAYLDTGFWFSNYYNCPVGGKWGTWKWAHSRSYLFIHIA